MDTMLLKEQTIPVTESNFTIVMNPANGQVTKGCSRPNAPGCSAAGTW